MKKIEQIDKNMTVQKISELETIKWIPIEHPAIRISGLPFFKKGGVFERIPDDRRKLLAEVNPLLDQLGTHTAGAQISFRTNSDRIYIKAATETPHNMLNMTPAGQCGFDCYAGRNREQLRFAGISWFDVKEDHYESRITQYPCCGQMTEFLIHFPLYNGVTELKLGIHADAELEPPEPFTNNGKLIFYGTSITQGGCASRPGMAYTNIIGRKLNMEVCNFGFSGNGLGEYEVADLLAEINNPALYIIDYEANAGANGTLESSLKGFIQILRKAHLDTPILVLSRLPYLLDELIPDNGEKRRKLRQFQKDTVEELQRSGDQKIYFYDGSKLWDDDFDEYTVDMVHPTDLGFYMMAKNLLPIIKAILTGKTE